MNSLKNMLVLKDLPSNLIEEAYVVLNPNLKIKIQEIRPKNEEFKEDVNSVLQKDYILEEAKYVLLNYISKFEARTDKINNNLLEKKYKKLKRITIITLLVFFLYVIFTNLF